ncbi:coiled-coil domain-containing protein [Coleofasciculus chthonoplastes]|uniref:coiled-coil domain-containing protein n=1 Tax=Coleofasciculus chthonoplastes TaxID=64178 RepID=UPI0032FB0BE7
MVYDRQSKSSSWTPTPRKSSFFPPSHIQTKTEAKKGSELVGNLPSKAQRDKIRRSLFGDIPEMTGAKAENAPQEAGLVPPQTHGRDTDFGTPDDPTKTKGKRHLVPRKRLTRFERMVDRIGRILATKTNVHVAVALDDNALVLSANVENRKAENSLENLVNKLKDIFNGTDPLNKITEEEPRIEQKVRREKDIKKVQHLLRDNYTNENSGNELNEEVRQQLIRIKKAINAGLINSELYHAGNPGIYVIATPNEKNQRTHNMHGELKVTQAITQRRNEKTYKGKKGKKNKYKEKDVYIGGTLADCFVCNATHKIMNTINKDWSFYSGGIHGGMFMGYRVPPHIESKSDLFYDLTGAKIVNDDKISKVNTNERSGEGKNSCADDSESDDETYKATNDFTTEFRKLQIWEKQIKENTEKQEKLQTKLKKQEKDLTGLQEELSASKESFPKQNQKEDLEQLKTNLERQMQENLEENQTQLESKKEALNIVKEKIKKNQKLTKITLDFDNEGKVGEKGWNPGASLNQSNIDKAVKNNNYEEVFNDYKEAANEYEKNKQKLEQKLKQELEKVNQKERQLNQINATEKTRTEMKEVEIQQGICKEEKTKAQESTQEKAVELKNLTAVTKLDWLNEKVIKDF